MSDFNGSTVVVAHYIARQCHDNNQWYALYTEQYSNNPLHIHMCMVSNMWIVQWFIVCINWKSVSALSTVISRFCHISLKTVSLQTRHWLQKDEQLKMLVQWQALVNCVTLFSRKPHGSYTLCWYLFKLMRHLDAIGNIEGNKKNSSCQKLSSRPWLELPVLCH